MTRRNFLELGALAGVAAAAPGCCSCGGKPQRYGKVALQLYSLGAYTGKVGFEKTLADVRAIGFEGVEFAGYHGWDAKKLKEQLAANGLTVCGTHVPNAKFGMDTKAWKFNPEVMKKTCEFELAYGNNVIICPGEGNFPPGCTWTTGQGGEPCAPSKAIDEFTKRLADIYNQAAAVAKTMGCRIGLHNHTWEHTVKLQNGTSFWDYFFGNTCKEVVMEQDVGWSTCAGVDCCEQYKKYPGRSPTLHAKENGMAKEVKQFDAILGQPGRDAAGKPCAKPVPWDRLFVASDADKVEWYVVECERHFDDPKAAVVPSFNFLKAKGRC